MIRIENKVDCCGCNACGDVCPKDAITFKTDNEGIWYPKIDIDKCIDCHLCEKVCPVLNHEGLNKENSEYPEAYVMQHKSAKERFNSTSGCLYPEIARYILENGGYVAGHIFNEDYTVRGYVTNKIEDLELLRNSKYLQSDMQGVYRKVKRLLAEGKQVLFSGCPCQIAAFKTYLKKDYKNFLTVDFTCMGIDSPKAFLKYIESLELKYRSKVVYFKSKSKETGWTDLTNKAIFENGKTYFGTRNVDSNLKATFLNVLVRPSCYDCKFKGFPRIADITIGDFWSEPRKEYASLVDNTGTSYYIANSEKALSFFENITSAFYLKKIDLKELFGGNPLMNKSLNPPAFDREIFYKELGGNDFSELVERYYNLVHSKAFLKPFVINTLRMFKRLDFSLLSFIRCFYHNVFNRHLSCSISRGDMLLYPLSAKLNLSKGAKIEVHGICHLGNYSSIKMRRESILEINNLTAPTQNPQIMLEADAYLSIGDRVRIGYNSIIDCSKSISIGGFGYIANNVTISDRNNGIICSDENLSMIESITIGEHCLIGENTVIRRGTKMGDEVIVEPNSVVTGDIPPRVKIAGTPATIINKDILWK